MYLVALVCTECRLVCTYDYIVSMFTSFICLSSNPSHSMVQGAKHITTADGDKAGVGFCTLFSGGGLVLGQQRVASTKIDEVSVMKQDVSESALQSGVPLIDIPSGQAHKFILLTESHRLNV